MTINIDSIWVLLGISITLGFGGYLGVLYAVLMIKGGHRAGMWIADRIINAINLVTRWRSAWKK